MGSVLTKETPVVHFIDERGVPCGMLPDATFESTPDPRATNCPRCIQALNERAFDEKYFHGNDFPLLLLARLALKFSRVERITRHEDGARPETDSDHVVMLGLVALSICPPRLNRGRVMEFVMVHDLLEAWTGDVQTLVISDEDRRKKELREKEAMKEMEERLGRASPVFQTARSYEEQLEPEARFVKVLDKSMPKLTHILNGCVAAKSMGLSLEDFRRAHSEQISTLSSKYPDQREALMLLSRLCRESEVAW